MAIRPYMVLLGRMAIRSYLILTFVISNRLPYGGKEDFHTKSKIPNMVLVFL